MSEYLPSEPYVPFPGLEQEIADLAYDVNRLFPEVIEETRRKLPSSAIAFHFTTTGTTARTKHSFSTEYSGIPAQAQNGIPPLGGTFRPGNVIDVLFSSGANSFFASIFLDLHARKIRYRLLKLANKLEGELKGQIEALPHDPWKGDVLIDKGDVALDREYVTATNRILDWLIQQASSCRG